MPEKEKLWREDARNHAREMIKFLNPDEINGWDELLAKFEEAGRRTREAGRNAVLSSTNG